MNFTSSWDSGARSTASKEGYAMFARAGYQAIGKAAARPKKRLSLNPGRALPGELVRARKPVAAKS